MLARRLAKRLQAEQQQQQLALNRGIRWADLLVDYHVAPAIIWSSSYILCCLSEHACLAYIHMWHIYCDAAHL